MVVSAALAVWIHHSFELNTLTMIELIKTKRNDLAVAHLIPMRLLLLQKIINALFPKKKLIGLLTVLGISILFCSCKKEPLDTYECINYQELSFDDQIFPILKLNCMNGSCHGQFDDYDYVKRFVDNKKLLGSIQHKKGYSPMPKNEARLADSLIVKISCWIQKGAPKN